MSGWSVEIEQWDDDGFHGTVSWNGRGISETVYAVPREVLDAVHDDTNKIVITIERLTRMR